jgi:hypothetical protein
MLTSHKKFGGLVEEVCTFVMIFRSVRRQKMPRMPLYKAIMKRTNYVRRFASYFSSPAEYFRGWRIGGRSDFAGNFSLFSGPPWKEICPPGTLSGLLTGGKKRGLTYSVKSDVIQFKSKSFNKPSLRS